MRLITTIHSAIVALVLCAGGCATSFTGDAHFPGGARGCAAKCQADGLQMASFVYMGEYSSGCVCAPPGQGTAPAVAATGAAAVGVVMQMRAQAAQQQAMQ